MHVHEIDQKVLQSQMFGTEFELFPLEYQNWLQLIVDVMNFELGCRNIISNAKFEHVQKMIGIHSSHYQIIRSFLLMCSQCEQAAIKLRNNVLKITNTLKREKLT